MYESWLYNPTTSTKLSSLLIILPLNSEVLPSFHTSVSRYSWTNSDMKRRGNHNGSGLLRVALMEEVLIWDNFCKIWWKTNKNGRRSRTKDYWLHSGNRSQATCQISENYSGQSFRAWRSPGCIAMAGKHYKSSKGNSGPWREPSGSDQDLVKRCSQDMVVGRSSETRKNPSLGTSSRRISMRRFFSVIAQKKK